MTQQTLFNVRVPVLSLHIVVADPIVSHDESRLTYLNDTKSNHIVPPVVSFLYKYMHKHIFFYLPELCLASSFSWNMQA
jgi:hypothetical protein